MVNDNDSMQVLAENIANYIRNKNGYSDPEKAVSFFKAKVVENNGDGTLTVQAAFDEPITVKCVESMADAEENDMVLVLVFGRGTTKNMRVISDASVSKWGGGSASILPIFANEVLNSVGFGSAETLANTVTVFQEMLFRVLGDAMFGGTSAFNGEASFNDSVEFSSAAHFGGSVSMDTPLPLTSGGLGASTASGGRDALDADQRLKSAATWAEAVANAKSEIIVCMYTGSDVYSVTIPRAEITTTQKTFYQGGAYSSGSLNHVQISVTTTTIAAGWYFNGAIRSQTYRLYYR